MNLLLKTLAAIALVTVSLTAGSYIIRSMGKTSNGDPPNDVTPQMTDNNVAKPQTEVRQLTGRIEIPKDDPLQPSYQPVNQPVFIQFLRQEGKTYHNMVAGKLSGQATKKDWGFKGTVYFDYIYTIDSRGQILKNDGVTVTEERTFGTANESLITHAYEVGVELPEQLGTLFSTMELWGRGTKVGEIGVIGKQVSKTVNHLRIPISKQLIDGARQIGLFTSAPDLDPANLERDIKLLTQSPTNRLLEGKKVRIDFIDGYGVKNIEPIDCSLTEQERDVIVRTNFIVDHYLFPDRKVAPGDEWIVDGSVLGGFVDPRLRGKVAGKINLTRTPDFGDAQGNTSKKLKLVDGNIRVVDVDGSSAINGEVSSLRGVAAVSDKLGVVTSAHFHGSAQYSKVSRDHLLFEAKTAVNPTFEVRYQCSVE